MRVILRDGLLITALEETGEELDGKLSIPSTQLYHSRGG